jgi:hypothetical protein
MPHDAPVRPLLSAATVIVFVSSLLALEYGVVRLFERIGPAADRVVRFVCRATSAVTLAGLIGIPVIVIGPALITPWQVVAYLAWLFVLAVLASAVLVPPLFFVRRE